MANCQEVSRSKRDDGSFLSNSAGPVAGNSQNKSQHSDNSVTDSSVTNSADDVNFLCDVDNLVTQLPLRKNAKTIDSKVIIIKLLRKLGDLPQTLYL